jgi:uncharacterized protein (TIGR03000 family)
MYSVVLMMAMTSGGDVADFGHRHGGCCGGESYSSCCGGSYGYSSCCGGSYSYSSCCGGYSGCCGGGHHRHHHGYSCCGGASYGCCGGYSVPVDCGCGAAVYTGCTGGVVTDTGSTGTADNGKTPSDKPVPMTAEDKKEFDRFVDGKSAEEAKKFGDDSGWNTMTSAERKKFYDETYKELDEKAAKDKKDADKDDKKPDDKKPDDKKPDDKKPDDKKPDDKKPDDKKDDKKPGDTLAPAPATIIVSLPANATLTIDDAATTSTASTRVFTSPVLPAGREFHYTLKAQIVRDGQSVVVTKEITVRAGETTHATLEAGLASVASR